MDTVIRTRIKASVDEMEIFVYYCSQKLEGKVLAIGFGFFDVTISKNYLKVFC